MTERVRTLVVGGGQAGLSVSHELARMGLEHLLLERGRVGESWRNRWDSFCLVTPNWSIRLPGGAYDGDDPDGFLPRDRIVDHLQAYASRFDAPVREGVEVTSLAPMADGGFRLETSSGPFESASVVVATGAYQRPYRPPGWVDLPPDVLQIDGGDYRNPAGIPDGRVLVVGSGQSGAQITEELLGAGREVTIACGRAPWGIRRIDGRDFFWWLSKSGFFEETLASLPPGARLAANILATGRDGGHDLHLRTLRAAGATLVGHFLGAGGGRARFARDLTASVAWGDERFASLMDRVRAVASEQGLPVPEIPEPEPIGPEGPEEVDLAGFGAAIFTGGFRPDYRWIRVPGAFDDVGYPIHADGESVAAPGLYFTGVHFLRTRKSSLFYGVGEDAAIVAERIAAAGR